MLSDEQLAKIGYLAMMDSSVAHPDPNFGWEKLSTLEMMELTAFATAVREALENKFKSTSHFQFAQNLLMGREKREDKKTTEYFREAVDIAFQQMNIRSNAEAAAWYTLRDWLKDHNPTIVQSWTKEQSGE